MNTESNTQNKYEILFNKNEIKLIGLFGDLKEYYNQCYRNNEIIAFKKIINSIISGIGNELLDDNNLNHNQIISDLQELTFTNEELNELSLFPVDEKYPEENHNLIAQDFINNIIDQLNKYSNTKYGISESKKFNKLLNDIELLNNKYYQNNKVFNNKIQKALSNIQDILDNKDPNGKFQKKYENEIQLVTEGYFVNNTKNINMIQRNILNILSKQNVETSKSDDRKDYYINVGNNYPPTKRIEQIITQLNSLYSQLIDTTNLELSILFNQVISQFINEYEFDNTYVYEDENNNGEQKQNKLNEIISLPSFVITEDQLEHFGVHYTQEEIDTAQEGDDAFGKTTEDWKVGINDTNPQLKELIDNLNLDDQYQYSNLDKVKVNDSLKNSKNELVKTNLMNKNTNTSIQTNNKLLEQNIKKEIENQNKKIESENSKTLTKEEIEELKQNNEQEYRQSIQDQILSDTQETSNIDIDTSVEVVETVKDIIEVGSIRINGSSFGETVQIEIPDNQSQELNITYTPEDQNQISNIEDLHIDIISGEFDIVINSIKLLTCTPLNNTVEGSFKLYYNENVFVIINVNVVLPETIEVDGVTYSKTQSENPGEYYQEITTEYKGTIYYAYVLPETIEVDGITYSKIQPENPGETYELKTLDIDGTTYYAYVQIPDEFYWLAGFANIADESTSTEEFEYGLPIFNFDETNYQDVAEKVTSYPEFTEIQNTTGDYAYPFVLVQKDIQKEQVKISDPNFDSNPIELIEYTNMNIENYKIYIGHNSAVINDGIMNVRLN